MCCYGEKIFKKTIISFVFFLFYANSLQIRRIFVCVIIKLNHKVILRKVEVHSCDCFQEDKVGKVPFWALMFCCTVACSYIKENEVKKTLQDFCLKRIPFK